MSNYTIDDFFEYNGGLYNKSVLKAVFKVQQKNKDDYFFTMMLFDKVVEVSHHKTIGEADVARTNFINKVFNLPKKEAAQ